MFSEYFTDVPIASVILRACPFISTYFAGILGVQFLASDVIEQDSTVRSVKFDARINATDYL